MEEVQEQLDSFVDAFAIFLGFTSGLLWLRILLFFKLFVMLGPLIVFQRFLRQLWSFVALLLLFALAFLSMGNLFFFDFRVNYHSF